jgi:hypothetical protein
MKDLQETLGHSSITITGDSYTSVIHELDTERAKADAATALVPRMYSASPQKARRPAQMSRAQVARMWRERYAKPPKASVANQLHRGVTAGQRWAAGDSNPEPMD